MFQLLKTFVKFSFFLLRSTSRSLVIGENSSMLISSMDFIRYSSRLIANTSDYNSFALGLLGRNAPLSVSAMNSSFPGLYTIFKLYLRSCNNILWSLLGLEAVISWKCSLVFAESATLVPHNPFVSTWRCLCGSREPLAVKPLQKTKVWTEAHLRWLLHQEGRQEIDWTYIVFSKFESPAKVESHNAIASIFTSYRTFLEPLFTGTHLTRTRC